MDLVLEALKSVDAAVRKNKTKEKRRLAEVVGHISSHLVLLIAHKLATFLRESLGVLYKGIGLPALQLASSIFRFAYHERLLPTIGSVHREGQHLWEVVLHALLAGVLDFLDDHDTNHTKTCIGEALFSALGEACFSLTAPKTNVDLRCTAYNILCDAAAFHQVNQQRLQRSDILGGERLGSCIWRTKDYLAMEGLLNLFARTLPSTHNSSSGRAKRTAYIQSVFTSCAPPEVASAGSEIAELLEHVPSSNWDESALKIVGAMARANITYPPRSPQPFAVREVLVFDCVYPSDRLYADDKTFLVNVLLGDEQYDSLEIAYSIVNAISATSIVRDTMQVVVSLKNFPRLGKNVLKPKTSTNQEESVIQVQFDLDVMELERFLGALDSRGLSHLVTSEAQQVLIPKLSLAAAPANLEIDSSGRLVPEPSQEERIETVSQFYKTNESSDDIVGFEAVHVLGDPASRSSSPVEAPLPYSLSEIEHVKLPSTEIVEAAAISVEGDADAITVNTSDVAPALENLIAIHAAAFGLSDEELSEISDCDDHLPLSPSKPSNTLKSSASLVRGRISFQPMPLKAAGMNSSATILARGRAGRIVLDSDVDSPPPTSAPARRTKKAALIPAPTLDDYELLPATSLNPQPEVAPLPVPQVVVSSLPGDETLVSSDNPGKLLRFSDLPGPDFNAALSSPAVVAKSALKSAFAKKCARSKGATLPALDPGTLAADTNAPLSFAAAIETNDIVTEETLSDFVPWPSSPTPSAKKSIKGKLRKRDREQRPSGKAVRGGTNKRKSHVLIQDDSLPAESNAQRPGKRVRKSNAADVTLAGQNDGIPGTVIVEERTEPQPRSPAAVRNTRKYHARKGRTSSPQEDRRRYALRDMEAIDYDALPSPPRTSAATARSSSPLPKGKKVVKLQKEDDRVPQHTAQSKAVSRVDAQVQELPTTTNVSSAKSARKTRASMRARGKALDNTDDVAYLDDDVTLVSAHHDEILGITEDVDAPALSRDGATTSSAQVLANLKKHLPFPVDTRSTPAAVIDLDSKSKSLNEKEMNAAHSQSSASVFEEQHDNLIPGENPQRGVPFIPLRYTEASTPMATTQHDPIVPGGEFVHVPMADRPPSKTKREAETIDLTLESPLPSVRESPIPVLQVEQLPQAVDAEDPNTTNPATESAKPRKIATSDRDDDILRYLRNFDMGVGKHIPRRSTALGKGGKETFVIPRSTEIEGSMYMRNQHRGSGTAFQTQRNDFVHRYTRSALSSEDKPSGGTPMQDLMNVMMRLHEVIVANIESKFESVRHGARIGRNELLQNAISDLQDMRARSVEHFNRLVDLEAEYATAGRGLIQESEDWRKLNGELTVASRPAVERHDRAALSKKFPSSLIVPAF
ncbi:hypothetical protein BN946_scf185011.g10 [Trametes cinnabarina]|uniref:Uncharacterized protein n=1 Tax=Pycnoporus cinnabarinus TaxID=5643 RepID=A0A060SQC7_PYCCI|nr:hypothetical protein BN946_scf185011.g10 [Trametes cinnabarina]